MQITDLLNVLDIVIMIPLGYGVYKGWKNGFMIEVSTLVALLLGLYFAINYSDIAKNLLINQLDIHSSYIEYFAFIITFVIVVIAINFLGKALSKLLSAMALGLINKIFGVVFSLLKYAIILTVIIIVTENADKKLHFMSQKFKNKSILYREIYKHGNEALELIDMDKIKAQLKNK